MHSRSVLASLTALLFVAACGDRATTAPSMATVPDVAQVLQEMTPSWLSDLSLYAAAYAESDLATVSEVDPSTCAYAADSGFFTCPTVTNHGLTYSVMYRLIDAAGNPQSQPSTQTVAIRIKATIKGTRTSMPTGPAGQTDTYTVDATSDHTMSGLQSLNQTLNGVSTADVKGQRQVGSIVLPIHDQSTETTTALVLPNRNVAERWIKSGSIKLDAVTNADDAFFRQSFGMLMTFNGTSAVALTITGPFGTRSCTVDLTATSLMTC